MSKFNGSYRTAKFQMEKNSGELITDTTGYVSPNARINYLIQAGIRLQDYRDSQCDLPDGVDLTDINPLPYRPDELTMLEESRKSRRKVEAIEHKLAQAKAAKEAAEAPKEAKTEGAKD